MKKCVIAGCPFPGVWYFGDMPIPEDEDAIKIWKEECMWCQGNGCKLCDMTGKMDVFDWTCEVSEEPYLECIFHVGIPTSILWFFRKIIRKVKGWIK